MVAEIESVSVGGAFVSVLSGSLRGRRAWLPAAEWSLAPSDWSPPWHTIEAGDLLDVAQVSEGGGPDNVPIVSRIAFGWEDVNDDLLHEERSMVVESVGRALIRGRVGNIPAIIRRDSYDAWTGMNVPKHLRDHAFLATGDVLSGIVTKIWEDLSEGQPVWDRSSRHLSADRCVELDVGLHLDFRSKEIRARVQSELSVCADADDVEPICEPLTLPLEIAEKIQSVLLVENDDDCRQAIAGTLAASKVGIAEARDSVTALRLVTALGEKRHSGDDHDIPPLFTIAIIDPNLRVERYDLDGLQVARALAQTGTTRIIIMSGEPSYVRKIAEYGDLLVHGYLAKPFTVERLIQEIESAFVVEAMPLTEWLRQTAGDQGGPHDNEVTMRSPVMPPVLTSTTTMKQALDRLTHSRPGSVAHIFQLHPRSLRSRSLEHSGEGLDWEPLCGKIGKSIIKDAAFSATDVVSSPFSEPDEHLWTLQMMKYGSFCGTAVNAPGPYRYALVAFHSNTQPFDSQFLLEAHLCAEKVGRILERRDLARTRDVEASYTATGMALESLAHEMHTDFLTLQHQASMVIGSVIDPAVPNSGQADESRLWAGRLMSKLLSTQEKVNVLWGRRGKKEKVSVQECIRRAAQGCLAAIAATSDDPSRIDIAVPDADEEERWIVRASPGALVIVFFNLYLNAAQQIALSSQVRRFGRVWHTIERREDAGGHPCALVRIHDTGPGIHPDDWERIFERGYSTRPDGTGIGLSICRHLVASGAQEKGRPADIRVTRSTLWDGTTITVRLPLQDTEPGGS